MLGAGVCAPSILEDQAYTRRSHFASDQPVKSFKTILQFCSTGMLQ